MTCVSMFPLTESWNLEDNFHHYLKSYERNGPNNEQKRKKKRIQEIKEGFQKGMQVNS